jgi:hypothetical protein
MTPLNPVMPAGPSGYVPLPAEIMLDGRTGPLAMGTELLVLDGAFALGRTPSLTTAGKFNVAMVGALLSGDSRRSITSYRHALIIEQPMPLRMCAPGEFVISMKRKQTATARSHPIEALLIPPKGVESTAATPAEEIRSLTGLSPALLASLFGVSRTTYYKWMEGATPRDARFQHLVEVLAHVKDAERRLAPKADIAAWLRTPVAPGGPRPLDYLQQRRFSTFRGLVLRERSAGVELKAPLPSSLSAPPISRSQYMVASERINPSPRMEDDRELNDDGDGAG